jgi:hypothetical protein
VEFLDRDDNDERSLKEIATEIVDGYHEMLLKGIKKPATPLREGMLLKSPFDAKVRRVAWLSDSIEDGSRKLAGSASVADDAAGGVWIIHEASSYGWLGPLTSPAWSFCEEHHPTRMVDTDTILPSGKPKRKSVEMTDEEIAEAWSNPDWAVGDRVSQSQRAHTFEVIAAGPQCVLMKHAVTGVLAVDSNKNLSTYYKREHQW